MTDMHRETIERLTRERDAYEHLSNARGAAYLDAIRERDAAIAALREAREALEILKPRCAYVVTGDHGFDGYVTAEWVEEKKAATITRINELTKDTP